VSLFVDSSVWYAAADGGDRGNARARDLLLAQERLVTSDHVLVETWLLLRARLGRHAADRFWERLLGGVADIEPVRAGDLERAWVIAAAFPDQNFSIVDRTSFALMQRLGLERVASFDDDFAVFRYGIRRERAFTIVR
jgi:predicted nucleic acid-binding protein